MVLSLHQDVFEFSGSMSSLGSIGTALAPVKIAGNCSIFSLFSILLGDFEEWVAEMFN